MLPANELESGRPCPWARAKVIPCEARLALNRHPARCIHNYYLDKVLGKRAIHQGCSTLSPTFFATYDRYCRFRHLRAALPGDRPPQWLFVVKIAQ